MSRFYGMSVRISNYDPAKADAIIEAATEEWPFEGLVSDDAELSGYGEDHLNAGYSEEDFVADFTAAVWRANGAYCDVVVSATYLEDLPSESYQMAKADYARLVADKTDTQTAEGVDDEDHVDRGD